MQAEDPALFNYYHAGQVKGEMVVIPCLNPGGGGEDGGGD